MMFLRRKSAEFHAWISEYRWPIALTVVAVFAVFVSVDSGLFATHVAHAQDLNMSGDVPGSSLPPTARSVVADPDAAPVTSSVASTVLLFLARILQVLVGFVGELLIWFTGILINVAQYNDFVTSAAVVNGWVIVRDVTNMFFVLVLLLIAFGTILGHEKWNYKNKTVNKLIIAAIVVNFSRTIVGLLIDFSQVVMLTFVLGFKEIAGGNFADAFRINKIFEPGVQDDVTADKDAVGVAFDIVLSYMLALVMAGISLAVIIYMTAALVIRIVFLWLLVVLSPLAFFLRAVPGKSGKFDDWWKMLTEQLVFGPLMAFFLWLSLASVAGQNHINDFPASASGGVIGSGKTAAWSSNELQSFVVAIALLLGGISMAEKMAGATGAYAKKAVDGSSRRLVGVAKGVGGFALAGAGKISVPVGREIRDADTGKIRREMVQLGSLATAGVGKVKSSALGKSLFDKEYKENKKTEQDIKALEATGQSTKAAAMREDLLNKASKGLPSDKAALRGVYEKELAEHPGSTKQKAAALKLAEAGMLEKNDIAEAAKGDKSFEKMLTAASAKSGKKPLLAIEATDPAEAKKQAQDVYDGLAHQGEKAKFAQAAIEGAMKGRDGKPRDANAIAALEAIDADSFDEFSPALKQKLLNSMEQAGLGAKVATLLATTKTSKLGLTADASAAQSESEARLMKERGLLVTAGAVESAFEGLDPETGNFANPATAAEFNAFMKKDAKNRKAFVKSVPPSVLMANGGDNDMAAALFEHMKPGELEEVVKDLDVSRDQAFAVMQAAKKMKDSARNTVAATNATDMAMLYSAKGSSLAGAYSERTYKADVGRTVLQAGTAATASVAKGAIMGTAIYFAAPAMAGAGIIATGAAAAGVTLSSKKVGEAVSAALKEFGEQRISGWTTKIGQRLAEQSADYESAKRKIRYGVPRAGMKV